jgi:hypothetical protein
MVPTGKELKAASPAASSDNVEPTLPPSAITTRDAMLPVRPLLTDSTNTGGSTKLRVGSMDRSVVKGSAYPFYLNSIFSGLIPPFSPFFFAILAHYQIQALHLQPNSILLLSVFAFYCEAFVGVQPSVALFRHFFSLCLSGDKCCTACVSFIEVKRKEKAEIHLKAGKKVEVYRNRWILMEAKEVNPLLEVPTSLPVQHAGWKSKELTDPLARPVLAWIVAHGRAKLSGPEIVREFLVQRIAPLQRRPRPLW